MHGISSSYTDTFTSSNTPGQAIAVVNKSPNATYPTTAHLISNFTSTSVTGAGAVLTFDVQISGAWSDSGTPPVAIVGSISGQLQGIVNAQIISAVRVRSSNITGGSCAVNSTLIPIH